MSNLNSGTIYTPQTHHSVLLTGVADNTLRHTCTLPFLHLSMFSSILSFIYFIRFAGEGAVCTSSDTDSHLLTDVDGVGLSDTERLLLGFNGDCISLVDGALSLRLLPVVGETETGRFLLLWGANSIFHFVTNSEAEDISENVEEMVVLFHSCVLRDNIIRPFSQQN